MAKLPIIKDKELIRALNKLGFFKHRQKGTSHLILKHPNGRRTTIPIHPNKDIPRGTLRSILRDIDISPENFKRLL